MHRRYRASTAPGPPVKQHRGRVNPRRAVLRRAFTVIDAGNLGYLTLNAFVVALRRSQWLRATLALRPEDVAAKWEAMAHHGVNRVNSSVFIKHMWRQVQLLDPAMPASGVELAPPSISAATATRHHDAPRKLTVSSGSPDFSAASSAVAGAAFRGSESRSGSSSSSSRGGSSSNNDDGAFRRGSSAAGEEADIYGWEGGDDDTSDDAGGTEHTLTSAHRISDSDSSGDGKWDGERDIECDGGNEYVCANSANNLPENDRAPPPFAWERPQAGESVPAESPLRRSYRHGGHALGKGGAGGRDTNGTSKLRTTGPATAAAGLRRGSENETATTDASTTADDDDALASARERAENEIEDTLEWHREAQEAKVAEDNERKRRDDAEAKQQRRELDLERMIGMACGEGREARQLCRSIFDRIDRKKRGTIRIESLRAAFHTDDEIAVLLGLPKAFHEIPPATKGASADAGAGAAVEEPDLVLMFLKSMLLRHPAAKDGGGRRDRGRQSRSNGGKGSNGSSSNNLSRVQFCRYFLSRPHGVRRRGENVWVYACVCMCVCTCARVG